jgi:hypothetical protein
MAKKPEVVEVPEPTTSNLSDAQRKMARTLDLAGMTIIAYSAPKVPPLGNLTPEGLLEDLGRVNAAKKAIEKVEKTLKERMKVLLAGKAELRSDNFNLTYKGADKNALDQTAAKKYFEKQGILADYMKESVVMTMTVKEN